MVDRSVSCTVGDRFWSPARNLVFDAYQRFMPRPVSRFPAVIIDIDERSLTAFGRWPWPRTRLAQLIEATHKLGALAVGIDIIMPEADVFAGPSFCGPVRNEPRDARSAGALPSNDAVLASTMRQIPSVIARAALNGKQKILLPAKPL